MDNKILISAEDNNLRLDRVIRARLPALKQGQLEKFVRQGKIRLDAKKVKAGVRVHSGQQIELKFDINSFLLETVGIKKKVNESITLDSERRKALRLIESWKVEETPEWLAINKPSGIAVQGGTSTKNHIDRVLKEAFGDERPRLVHRIDKDTSGVLLLAKSEKSARYLTRYFREQTIEKTYLAFCIGKTKKSGKISEPIIKLMLKRNERMAVDRNKGLAAMSLFERLYYGKGISMVCLRPLTGRTHQLRVHMEYFGTPILGDGKYAGKKAHPDSEFSRKMHLHSHFLSLPDGHVITAKVPEHMQLAANIIGAIIPKNKQFFHDI